MTANVPKEDIGNIGFAIPINSIRSIVERIIEKGYIADPCIDISVLNVAEEPRHYGIPTDSAGLQAGD